MLRFIKRLGIVVLVFAAVVATVPLIGRLAHLRVLTESSPHKIFVVLGFHTSFYHSWRGDTPDEAGFGTDIRVVRAILRMLDEANARGLDARGYWEADAQFTLESILPAHAPDILEGIRRRVDAGKDEVLIAPYNNGMLSSMTADEVRASLRWAVTNPWGSGANDLFGRHVPIVRPQEYMFTSGLIPLLREEGMEGLILAYSSYPFTTFSNYVPLLPPEQRFGLTWLRTEADGPRILLFPSVSTGDIVDNVSFEKWLLDLRELQLDGSVDGDLVIHLNFDADAETWLPLAMPPGLGWLPNTGGLPEFIEAVNEYDWAEFTTPSEFIARRQPVGEVLLDRDTADGGWDGYFSWTEKHGSQEVWTRLQQSRLFEQQALAIAASLPGNVAGGLREAYFAGPEGSFFQRVKALSTTHFGMSNPLVNEERYAVGMATVERARERALQALRSVSRARAQYVAVRSADQPLYVLEVHGDADAAAAGVPLRVPLLLADAGVDVEVIDAAGDVVPSALLEPERLDGSAAAELVLGNDATSRPQPLRVRRGRTGATPTPATEPASVILRNDRVQLALSTANGVDSLLVDGERVGGADFLSSFVTYRTGEVPQSYEGGEWSIEIPAGERPAAWQRARLHSQIALETPDGKVSAVIRVDFTLPPSAPFVIADVTVRYPYTEKRDVLSTPMQKLRMLIDSRWIEAAPFQLHPEFGNAAGERLRVWRENHLGRVGGYPLNYGTVNPRNADVDTFNHHVTGPWVAVSGGGSGLLIAQDAMRRTSAAFAPMRLREIHGRQLLWINPFGSYFGEPMDYSHMGGNGLGTEFARRVSPASRANGPSFNGQSARFSLLLAPYRGDEPPADLQHAARAFHAPPAVVYLRTPDGIEVRVPSDMYAQIDARRRDLAARGAGPLAPPRAVLASPTRAGADLVWDEPEDARVDSHEVQWRPHGRTTWDSVEVAGGHRHRVADLVDGVKYEFRVRARAGGRLSDWSPSHAVLVGPVGEQSVLGFASHINPQFVLRIAHQALVHLVTVP